MMSEQLNLFHNVINLEIASRKLRKKIKSFNFTLKKPVLNNIMPRLKVPGIRLKKLD